MMQRQILTNRTQQIATLKYRQMKNKRVYPNNTYEQNKIMQNAKTETIQTGYNLELADL